MKDELKRCKDTWLETLARFGVKRGLMASEELEIGRAIQKYGAENVELALFGAGFEPKSEKFNPADFIKISRILRPDHRGEERIDRFVNLGARERARQEEWKRMGDEMEARRKAAEAEPVMAPVGRVVSEEEQRESVEKAKAYVASLASRVRGMPR